MHRSRFAALFFLGTVLLVSPPGSVSAAGSAADQICFADRVYTDAKFACGQPILDTYGKPTGKISGYKCKCIDTEKAGVINGHCVGPLDCHGDSATDLSGEQQKLTPLTLPAIQKTLQGSAGSGADIQTVQANTPPSQSPNPTGSILEQAVFNPAPLSQQSLIQSNSANGVNQQLEAVTQSQPAGFIQQAEAGFKNFFSPTPVANDVVRLQGGTLPDTESNAVQTSQETGGTAGPSTFQQQMPDQASTFQQSGASNSDNSCDPASPLCKVETFVSNGWKSVTEKIFSAGAVDTSLNSDVPNTPGVDCAANPSLCPSSQTGVVSWYDCSKTPEGCIGTANNKLDPTASTLASSYPINTVVKVCDAGGTCVAAVSNDSGGFIGKDYKTGTRVADLSPAVFEQFAPLDKGLIKGVTVSPVALYADYQSAQAAADAINRGESPSAAVSGGRGIGSDYASSGGTGVSTVSSMSANMNGGWTGANSPYAYGPSEASGFSNLSDVPLPVSRPDIIASDIPLPTARPDAATAAYQADVTHDLNPSAFPATPVPVTTGPALEQPNPVGTVTQGQPLAEPIAPNPTVAVTSENLAPLPPSTADLDTKTPAQLQADVVANGELMKQLADSRTPQTPADSAPQQSVWQTLADVTGLKGAWDKWTIPAQPAIEPSNGLFDGTVSAGAQNGFTPGSVSAAPDMTSSFTLPPSTADLDTKTTAQLQADVTSNGELMKQLADSRAVQAPADTGNAGGQSTVEPKSVQLFYSLGDWITTGDATKAELAWNNIWNPQGVPAATDNASFDHATPFAAGPASEVPQQPAEAPATVGSSDAGAAPSPAESAVSTPVPDTSSPKAGTSEILAAPATDQRLQPAPQAPVGETGYRGDSVVDYLESAHMDSSYAMRQQLAAQYGISGFRGTGTQNVQLLRVLRGY